MKCLGYVPNSSWTNTAGLTGKVFDHVRDLEPREAVNFTAAAQAFSTGLVCSLIRNEYDEQAGFIGCLDDSRSLDPSLSWGLAKKMLVATLDLGFAG